MKASQLVLDLSARYPSFSRPLTRFAALAWLRLAGREARFRPHWLLRSLVRSNFLRIPVRTSVDDTIDIIVPWCDQVGDAIASGSYELETLDLIRRLLGPEMTFLDIGAHAGLYSLIAAKIVGPGGQVHSFEAEPVLASWIERSARLNGLSQVAVNATVLSDRDGEVAFHHASDPSVNSLVEPRDIYDSHIIKLKSMRLSGYLERKQIGRIDLIKIDIEGAELQVLRSIEDVLRSAERPTLIVEFADSRGSLVTLADFLSDCGYALYQISDGQLSPFTSEDLQEHSEEATQPAFNALALPRGAPLPE